MLGGGAGTTRDCFELIHQAEKYGARVALFGRKINLAESPLDIVQVHARGGRRRDSPREAVKAYHDALRQARASRRRAISPPTARSPRPRSSWSEGGPMGARAAS